MRHDRAQPLLSQQRRAGTGDIDAPIDDKHEVLQCLVANQRELRRHMRRDTDTHTSDRRRRVFCGVTHADTALDL